MMKRNTILAIAALLVFTTVNTTANTKPRKVQRATVNLYEEGYKPDSITLRRGVLAKLTFIRRAEGCGDVVVIPAYGIHRNLPMNTPVVVTFSPRRNGTFKFACGMDMYRGQIIVD
jgi:plastocyanin domain-containing protein